jgi:hypothetical protein
MATTYKLLGSSAPGTAGATLYTVPTGFQAVASSLVITNLSSSAANFTVVVKTGSAGATLDNNFISYQTAIPANDSVIMTLGLALSSSYVVQVSGSTSKVAFNLFGAELN